MYTVKWIGPGGCEFLYVDARGVSYTPAGDGTPAMVSFYFRGEHSHVADCHAVIDLGRIYVMNDSGRTVADYSLGSPEFPRGLAPRQAA